MSYAAHNASLEVLYTLTSAPPILNFRIVCWFYSVQLELFILLVIGLPLLTHRDLMLRKSGCSHTQYATFIYLKNEFLTRSDKLPHKLKSTVPITIIKSININLEPYLEAKS